MGKRIAIACPNRDDFTGETVCTLMVLAAQCVTLTGEMPIVIAPQTAFIDKSRNAAVEIALSLNADYVLFVDSDVSVITDGDVLRHMVDLRKDVVVGVYVDRAHPFRPHVYTFCPQGIRSVPDIPQDGIFKIEATGCGFMLIRREVLQKLSDAAFIAAYGKPFDFLNYGTSAELREDVAFCHRVQAAGFEIWGTPHVKLAHLGKMAFTLDHWEFVKAQILASNNPIEGWMSDAECAWLRETAKTMTGGIVEIGAWKGRSTKELLDSGNRVVAVDTFAGSTDPRDQTFKAEDPQKVYDIFMQNVGQYTNLEVCAFQTSLMVAESFLPRSVDMVFIDASHDFENVRDDILAWKSKARKIICGHDYCATWPGVVKAVNECFPDGDFRVVESIWIKELDKC